jgi:hypothetical protein
MVVPIKTKETSIFFSEQPKSTNQMATSRSNKSANKYRTVLTSLTSIQLPSTRKRVNYFGNKRLS